MTASCPSPDHADKRASWFIRNIPGKPYHAAHACQGCGFRGGPIALAQIVLGIERDAAREWLADLEQPQPLPRTVELEVIELKSRRFSMPAGVLQDPEVDGWTKPFARYLLDDRSLEWSQVQDWRIGYVPFKGINPDGSRHRLAGRVVIPIHDVRGKLCSYTARAIKKTERLRYLEPQEQERPTDCLFGEAGWCDKTAVVVVEGVFDALAVERALIHIGQEQDVAVAALRGSNPSSSELARLARFRRLIAMTDPDAAGKKALAQLKAACGRHCRVLPVFLTEGMDPDELGLPALAIKLDRVLAA
jgi:hypothetical protein